MADKTTFPFGITSDIAVAANFSYEWARNLGITFNSTQNPHYEWASGEQTIPTTRSSHFYDGNILVPVDDGVSVYRFDVINPNTMTLVGSSTTLSRSTYNTCWMGEAVRVGDTLYFLMGLSSNNHVRLFKMPLSSLTISDLGEVDTGWNNGTHSIHAGTDAVYMGLYNGGKKCVVATDTISSYTNNYHYYHGVDDGEYYWVRHPYTLYQLTRATMAYVNYFSITGGGSCPPVCMNGHIWTDSASGISMVNQLDGTEVATFSPAGAPSQMVCAGSHLWYMTYAYGAYTLGRIDGVMMTGDFNTRSLGAGYGGCLVGADLASLFTIYVTSTPRCRLQRLWMR